MRRAIRLIILIPLGIILIALALANRASVLLSLDPIRPDTPAASVTVPLFVALFGALIVGIIIGGIAAWAGQGKVATGGAPQCTRVGGTAQRTPASDCATCSRKRRACRPCRRHNGALARKSCLG